MIVLCSGNTILPHVSTYVVAIDNYPTSDISYSSSDKVVHDLSIATEVLPS